MTSAPSFRLLPVEATEAMLRAMYVTPDMGPGGVIIRHSVDKLPDAYRAMLAAAPVMAEATPWLPISSAPKDGRKIDVWCASPGSFRGVRFTDVSWRAHDGTWGWIMDRPDRPDGFERAGVEWVILELGNDVYPPWTPTHWMPRAEPPDPPAPLVQTGKESGE